MSFQRRASAFDLARRLAARFMAGSGSGAQMAYIETGEWTPVAVDASGVDYTVAADPQPIYMRFGAGSSAAVGDIVVAMLVITFSGATPTTGYQLDITGIPAPQNADLGYVLLGDNTGATEMSIGDASDPDKIVTTWLSVTAGGGMQMAIVYTVGAGA